MIQGKKEEIKVRIILMIQASERLELQEEISPKFSRKLGHWRKREIKDAYRGGRTCRCP